MNNTNSRGMLSRAFLIVGGILTVAGAIDPMEGSVLILPGGGLTALGAFLDRRDQRVVAYRVTVFLLLALGIGALWGLSFLGGFGGDSGRSSWWGLLIVPYCIGLPLALGGPGFPPWLLCAGICVGIWYLVMSMTIIVRPGAGPGGVLLILAAVGLLVIGECTRRLIALRAKPRNP